MYLNLASIVTADIVFIWLIETIVVFELCLKRLDFYIGIRLIETIVVFEFCKNHANIFEDGWLIETIVVFEFPLLI